MITYTNHFKSIIDQIKSIIISEFPRFGGKNRILFGPIDDTHLGPEDVIFLRPMQDNFEVEDTGGRTSVYVIELVYITKMPAQTDYYKLTDIGEHLKRLFGAGKYRNNHSYWHYCNVTNINYAPDMLAEFQDTAGFSMLLEIHASQY